MAQKNRQMSLPEPPLAEIKKFIEEGKDGQTFTHVAVIVRERIGNRSQIAMNKVMPTNILGTPEMEALIGEERGGGQYNVTVVDPNNMQSQLLTKWEISIAGPSIKQQQQQAPQQQQPWGMANGMQMGQMPYFQPQQQQQQQEPHRRGSNFKDPPAPQAQVINPMSWMAKPPDAYVGELLDGKKEELRERDSQLAGERAARDGDRRASDDKFSQLMNKFNEEREKHRDDLRQLEMRMFEQRSQQQPAPQTDWVGMVGAFAPIIAAFMQSQGETRKLEQDASSRAAELQAKSLELASKSISDQKKGDSDMVKTFMPMMLAQIDAKSPDKQAELVSAMGEQQLTQLSMFQNMFTAMQGEEPAPWIALVQEGLKGIVEVASAQQEQRREDADEARAARLEKKPAPQQVAASIRDPQQPQQPMSLVAYAEAVVSSDGYPESMKGEDWKARIVEVHDPNIAVETVAENIVNMIEALYENEALPEEIDNVYKDPRAVLGDRFFGQMHIKQGEPARYEAIIDHVVKLIEVAIEAEVPESEPDLTQPAKAVKFETETIDTKGESVVTDKERNTAADIAG